MSGPFYDTILGAQLPHKEGDHDKFAHYANASDVTKAFVMGTKVTALCGKRWVPTRDGASFPVCHTCKEIFNQLP